MLHVFQRGPVRDFTEAKACTISNSEESAGGTSQNSRRIFALPKNKQKVCSGDENRVASNSRKCNKQTLARQTFFSFVQEFPNQSESDSRKAA